MEEVVEPEPKEKVGAEAVVELPKEKMPLLDSAAVEAVVEEAEEEEAPKAAAPPLPKENSPVEEEVGGAEEASAPAAAAAAAAVVEVVKVSPGFSLPEETQKEKVGFMEELQLLVGARAWDRLEKEKV